MVIFKWGKNIPWNISNTSISGLDNIFVQWKLWLYCIVHLQYQVVLHVSTLKNACLQCNFTWCIWCSIVSHVHCTYLAAVPNGLNCMNISAISHICLPFLSLVDDSVLHQQPPTDNFRKEMPPWPRALFNPQESSPIRYCILSCTSEISIASYLHQWTIYSQY